VDRSGSSAAQHASNVTATHERHGHTSSPLALPPGGRLPQDFELVAEKGPVRLSTLFGDADVPGFGVFSRHDGIVRHFYTGEMSGATADRGQDPRGGPDLDPLWLMLDLTPGGRGTDWYPKL
jgi:predicted dithiol-disulfide oxidoreductase (DUF899 family)